jgi:hypothetical protein
MDIVRNADGTLVIPLRQERKHENDDDGDTSSSGADGEATQTEAAPGTRLLHPGEGGYDEVLAEWDLHAVASSPDHAVAPAVEALEDPEASAEALRHVLVGGVHSVEDFAAEVAVAEGGDPLPAHEATKIIGEVLAELE